MPYNESKHSTIGGGLCVLTDPLLILYLKVYLTKVNIITSQKRYFHKVCREGQIADIRIRSKNLIKVILLLRSIFSLVKILRTKHVSEYFSTINDLTF